MMSGGLPIKFIPVNGQRKNGRFSLPRMNQFPKTSLPSSSFSTNSTTLHRYRVATSNWAIRQVRGFGHFFFFFFFSVDINNLGHYSLFTGTHCIRVFPLKPCESDSTGESNCHYQTVTDERGRGGVPRMHEDIGGMFDESFPACTFFRWFQGLRVFRCNLPPALLEE